MTHSVRVTVDGLALRRDEFKVDAKSGIVTTNVPALKDQYVVITVNAGCPYCKCELEHRLNDCGVPLFACESCKHFEPFDLERMRVSLQLSSSGPTRPRRKLCRRRV